VPVVVGGASAYSDRAFRWDAFGWVLLGALAIQVAANFANDASDAKRGADSEDRLGPPRMVALGVIDAKTMWIATWMAIGVAAIAAVGLTIIAGPIILIIGFTSVIAMLGYVGGPVPYGYRGLGEVFVFVFFGLVATVGGRYVHDMTAPVDIWLLAIPIGMLATAILVVNNLRDIETDRIAAKHTLAVLIGADRTRTLFAVLIYGSVALIVAFTVPGWTAAPTALAGFLLPYATGPVRIVNANTGGPALIRALKTTAKLHLVTGLVLAAGLLVAAI
jgi:1,4-dihydroxy-2-naphthoate octaprenyltransferase